VGFPEEQWDDVEATVGVLLRWSGIDNVRPQLHLLSPQSGTTIMEKYGHRLEYDGWFADRSFFNRMCPDSEIKFVKEHPELCPACYFIPNERVGRKELARARDFTELLLHALPGIGPFIQRTEASPLDLIQRWHARCARKHLAAPNQTGYFALLSEDRRILYVRALLEELRSNPHLTDVHQSFLSFWERSLDLMSDSASPEIGDTADTDVALEEIDPEQELIPIVTRKAALVVLEHDVAGSLQDWSRRGVWNWPAKRPVHYLLVADEGQLQVTEVSPSAAMIFQWCDGGHTVSQLFGLVEGLDDAETERLKQVLDTASLIGNILGALREMVGLRLKIQGREA
jgi:hypothetical protein